MIYCLLELVYLRRRKKKHNFCDICRGPTATHALGPIAECSPLNTHGLCEYWTLLYHIFVVEIFSRYNATTFFVHWQITTVLYVIIVYTDSQQSSILEGPPPREQQNLLLVSTSDVTNVGFFTFATANAIANIYLQHSRMRMRILKIFKKSARKMFDRFDVSCRPCLNWTKNVMAATDDTEYLRKSGLVQTEYNWTCAIIFQHTIHYTCASPDLRKYSVPCVAGIRLVSPHTEHMRVKKNGAYVNDRSIRKRTTAHLFFLSLRERVVFIGVNKPDTSTACVLTSFITFICSGYLVTPPTSVPS